MQQARERLKTLSADPETRQLALARERSIFEEAMAMTGARAEGNAEERAALLRCLLIKRFGPLSPDTAERLQSATPEQLSAWFDRCLDAANLSAVFAEH